MKYRFENGFLGSFIFVSGEEGEEEKYDITGLTSLMSLYGEKAMSRESIHMLISELSKMGRELEKHNLDKNGWLLNPNYIYLEYGGKTSGDNTANIKFLYYSGKSDLNFQEELMVLAEFVINHVNYGFQDAIYLAYDFYLHVFRKNYIFDDILT